MIKKLSIILVFAICLAGCAVDPIKMVPGAKVIKSSKVIKLNKMVGEIPGIVVEVPADEVFSENLNLEDSLTKKDIMRVINEPGAKKALDAQMAREVAMEIKESNYEFWTKVTLVNFIAILIGWMAWTLRGWAKNRTPKVNPFSAPVKKETPLVKDKRGLHVDVDEPTEF